jgi:hypothetical protein
MIYGSCGHAVGNVRELHTLTVKYVDRHNMRSIKVGTHCPLCRSDLIRSGNVLWTPEDVDEWLTNIPHSANNELPKQATMVTW